MWQKIPVAEIELCLGVVICCGGSVGLVKRMDSKLSNLINIDCTSFKLVVGRFCVIIKPSKLRAWLEGGIMWWRRGW